MLDDLVFGFHSKLPVMLQTESCECGLACLGMIAAFHGRRTDVATLRRRFSISNAGVSLADLVQFAHTLQLATRPVRVELKELEKLRVPCVLHWNFNHFVVLKKARGHVITIHDPAVGVRRLSLTKTSASFTGIALELWPNAKFEPVEERQRLTVGKLFGRIEGVWSALWQVMSLALALEAISVVSPLFLQWIVDDGIATGDRELLTTLAVGFCLLVAFQTAIGAVRSVVVMYIATTLNVQWRANCLTHLLRLPIEFFEKRTLGDVVSRFGSIDQIQSTLTTSFVEGVIDGIMTVVTLAAMFLFSATLAWIAVAAIVLYALARWIWYVPLFTANREQIVVAAKQSTHFIETIRGIRAIKLFQREAERRSAWLATAVEQINAGLKTQRLQITFSAVRSLIVGVEGVVIIWLGARNVLAGGFTVGLLMAFNAYRGQFDTRVASLVDKILQLRLLRLHAERLADIVLASPQAVETELPGDQLVETRPSLRVLDVRFRYGEREPWILDGVNFEVAEGEFLAITGSSGCGKSTLVSLIVGLRAPTSGEIFIGDANVRHFGMRLGGVIATVMQDDVLFAGTIFDNICFFDPKPDRARVEDSARKAAIHSELVAMPMGYDSLVGDMGSFLSGGQKQRIILARALYKQPKILVLDEATSHLDLDRERLVSDAITGSSMTRIVIAHRPETIAKADRCIELVSGKAIKYFYGTPLARQVVSPR